MTIKALEILQLKLNNVVKELTRIRILNNSIASFLHNLPVKQISCFEMLMMTFSKKILIFESETLESAGLTIPGIYSSPFHKTKSSHDDMNGNHNKNMIPVGKSDAHSSTKNLTGKRESCHDVNATSSEKSFSTSLNSSNGEQKMSRGRTIQSSTSFARRKKSKDQSKTVKKSSQRDTFSSLTSLARTIKRRSRSTPRDSASKSVDCDEKKKENNSFISPKENDLQNLHSSGSKSRFTTLRRLSRSLLPKEINFLQTSQINDVSGNSSKNKDFRSLPKERVPGLMKVFCGSLFADTSYKTVMVTQDTTAADLLKTILDQYNVPIGQTTRYVICEVTGRLQEKKSFGTIKKTSKKKARSYSYATVRPDVVKQWLDSNFVEEYIRPLEVDEKPLIIQSKWKLKENVMKRFEVRKKSQILKTRAKISETSFKKTTLSRPKSFDLLSSAIDLTAENPPTMMDACCSFGQFKESLHLDVAKSKNKEEKKKSEEPGSEKKKESIGDESAKFRKRISSFEPLVSDFAAKSENTKLSSSLLSSPPSPYLLTLQGNEDVLIHSLDSQEIAVGSDVTGFKLTGSDILRHHCVIKKELEAVFSKTSNHQVHRHWNVTITPTSSEAEVLVDGLRITSGETLHHGMLVGIGQRHLFAYKDPSHHMTPSHVQCSLKKSQSSISRSSKDSLPGSTRTWDSSSSHLSSKSSVASRNQIIKTCLNYSADRQTWVVNLLFSSFRHWETFPVQVSLAPGILVCHCVVHACLNFNTKQKKKFLNMMSDNLQEVVQNTIGNIPHQQTENSRSTNCPHPILLALHPLVFWMSNTVQVLSFLKNNLTSILQQRLNREWEKGYVAEHVLKSIEEFSIDEKIFSELKEVITLAFQKMIYYLTKVLHELLPSILHTNPFIEAYSPSNDVIAVHDVLAYVVEMLRKYDVDTETCRQIFDYVFFFTNVYLFNLLMEDESIQYYRWETGVKLRGNLDRIEGWAVNAGYGAQYIDQLEKCSSLVNLLATPKRQLIKVISVCNVAVNSITSFATPDKFKLNIKRTSWYTLRSNFSALSTAQLWKVLSSYQDLGDKPMPQIWVPNTDEADKSNSDSILEDYEGLPPFFLPNATSIIDVSTLPKHPFLQNLCHRITHPTSLSLSTSKVEKNTIPRRTRKEHPRESAEALSGHSFPEMTSSSVDLCKNKQKKKILGHNIVTPRGSSPIIDPTRGSSHNINPPHGSSPIIDPPGRSSPIIDPPRESSPIINPPRESSSIINLPCGSSPIIDPPRGSSPIIDPPRESSSIINLPCGSSPIINSPRGSSPIIAPPRGSSPNIDPPRRSSPIIDPPRGSSPIVAPPRGSSPNIDPPRGSSPITDPPRGSSPIIDPPRGSSPIIAPPRGSSPNIDPPRGSSPIIDPPRGSSPNIAPPRGSSPNIDPPRGSSPIIDLRCGSSPNIDLARGSSPIIDLARGSRPKPSEDTTLSNVTSSSDEISVKSDCSETQDELLLLPVEAAPLKTSSMILTNHIAGGSRALASEIKLSANFPHKRRQHNIVVVNIKKDTKGIGIGFVDGENTVLGVAGVYVRFFVPESNSSKISSIRYDEVIRCWPKEGKLQLGDRILAVDGVNLLKVNYKKAITLLKQADDEVRLLVQRCGNKVAMKVLLPSQ